MAAQAPSAAPTTPSSKAVPADCIFCQIVAGKAPSRKVYEDRFVLAFWDIRPRAKVHLLVIPKQHVASLKELDDLPVETRAALLSACVRVAREQGILDDGFRVISNAGKDASQSVFHLHFHVVGGEKLREDAITKDLPKGP
ncbi:histidine triad nucleotide-binding protein [Geothrix sp.]|uniref:histidine triad nucleotide-binding protein n=1 Tax=Geothrix sp. TaxID=1962974 RepID=UPI00343BD3B1